MASFSDLLKGVNARLGFNADDPDRVDDNKDLGMTFTTKAKKNVDLTLSRTWESKQTAADSGEVTTTVTEKTSRKVKINHGDCTSSYTLANDKMAFDASGKLVDEKDMKVDIGGAAEIKQKKGSYKLTGKLSASASDLGGAKAALNVDADYNEKGEITVKPKLNLEVNGEINVGVSAKSDTKALQEIWPQLVYKPSDDKSSFYWLRADITRSLVSAGCDQALKDGIQHSFEAVFGYAGMKGLMGQPVALRAGVEYTLSDKSSLSVSGSASETYELSAETEHQLTDNISVGCTQSFDSDKLGGKMNPYHIGFSATYKL